MWGMKAMFLYLLNYPVHVIPWYLNASHYFDEIKTLFFFFFLVCVCVCCWDCNHNAHLNKHQLTLWPSIQGRCRAAIFNCILKQILLTSLDPIFSYVKWKRIGQQKKCIHGKPMADACEERITKNLIKMMQSQMWILQKLTSKDSNPNMHDHIVICMSMWINPYHQKTRFHPINYMKLNQA